MKNSGFSILEAVVGMALIGVGVAAFSTAVTQTQRASRRVDSKTRFAETVSQIKKYMDSPEDCKNLMSGRDLTGKKGNARLTEFKFPGASTALLTEKQVLTDGPRKIPIFIDKINVDSITELNGDWHVLQFEFVGYDGFSGPTNNKAPSPPTTNEFTVQVHVNPATKIIDTCRSPANLTLTEEMKGGICELVDGKGGKMFYDPVKGYCVEKQVETVYIGPDPYNSSCEAGTIDWCEASLTDPNWGDWSKERLYVDPITGETTTGSGGASAGRGKEDHQTNSCKCVYATDIVATKGVAYIQENGQCKAHCKVINSPSVVTNP